LATCAQPGPSRDEGTSAPYKPCSGYWEALTPELAFEGADGLRDLRSAAAALALLQTVERHNDEDVVAAAAHALVSMQTLEAETAVAALAGSDSPCLRRLASSGDLCVPGATE
jgi:hypothetical protein